MATDSKTSERSIAIRPAWGAIRVTGPDALTWLNGVVTCDVTAVDATRGAWGLLLSKQGKIEAELQIVRSEAGLVVATDADLAPEIAQKLDRFLVMEDAELEADPGLRFVEIHGPAASAAASWVVGAGVEVVASGRVDWSSQGGAVLVVAEGSLEAALGALREHGVFVVTLDEFAETRIREGIPLFGLDYGPSDNPHEASLERRTVSWTKGCYLGQEVVCMQDMRGKVKRRLVRLEVEAPVDRGARVMSEEGNEVGEVTSASGTWALARVKAPAFEAGARVSVNGAEARVHSLRD